MTPTDPHIPGLNSDPLEDLIRTLYTCGLDVPPGLPPAIISRGEVAVPFLADIVLTDTDLATADEAEGWAAVHAAVLLGAIGGLPAAEALAELIRLDDKDDILDDWLQTTIQSALGFCGPDAWDLARDIAADESLGEYHRTAGASALQIITWKHPHLHECTTTFLTDLLNKTTDPDLTYLMTTVLTSAVGADVRVRKAIDRVFDQGLIHPRYMTREGQ